MQDERLTDGNKDLHVVEGKVSNETFLLLDVFLLVIQVNQVKFYCDS